MVLSFPIRVGDDPGDAERRRQADLPIAVRRPPLYRWAHRHRTALTVGLFAFAVLAFSQAWTQGALVLEGQGSALYVRMALDHLGAQRAVPYWLPDLWAGSPIWAATPSLPTFMLTPLATVVGADVAVKLSVLAFQIAGACGAYVLARSLWNNRPAALVAGVLFGLQPLLVSYGALAGSQPTVGVITVTPWVVWSLRKALRGDGGVFVGVAGLLAGFAVLMQAEYAIGLAIVCVCLLAMEAVRVGTGRNPASPAQLLGRAAVVVAIGLGVAAYWLLPFVSLRDSFVLSPPELVQSELVHGAGAQVASEIGVFFGRAGELRGAVGFNREDLLPRLFHLGWACLALTLLSIASLARRREHDGTLAAVLLAGAIGIWLSTGAVPLASSGPAARTQWLPFVVAGLAAGMLLGAILRRMHLGRAAPFLALATVAFLASVPYLTPFITLQKLIPLFETLRFPRLYTVAPLALALGAAYPVVLARDWAERNRASSAPAAMGGALTGAVALAVTGLFLVDVWPHRSYYRVKPPAAAAAYRQVAAIVAEREDDVRVAPTQILPGPVNALRETERPLTIGWPHFVASTQIWRLTVEPFFTPSAYRERAYGLSATAYQVIEKPTEPGTAAEAVPEIDLVRNGRTLPMVRSYTRTVAMAGRDITPEMAVGLAHRNMGVYTGSPSLSPALEATTVVDVRSPSPCADDSGARLDAALASQLGSACALHAWLDTLVAGVDLLNIGPGIGGTFHATTNRLQGISAYLDRPPDRTEVTLHEVAAGGRSLGPELARGKAVGVDEYGLAAFTFDPIPASAGKEYGFVLTCGDCRPDLVPRLVAGHSVDRPGNLLVAGDLRRDRTAAFVPLYEAVAADPPSTTTVRSTGRRPGRWRVQADGPSPALVVVAEAWFPGWEARVDGRKAPLVEADGGFLGVPVDAGSHVVTLEYHRPAAATAGRLVTLATLLSLVVLAVRRRRRAPRAPSPPPAVAGPSTPPPPPAPAEPPVLVARERPRRQPPPAEEDEWDQVVKPRGPAGDDGQERPPPPPRRPGTARWPPEPY